MVELVPKDTVGIILEYRDNGDIAIVFNPNNQDFGKSTTGKTYTIASTNSNFTHIPAGLFDADRNLVLSIHVCEGVKRREKWLLSSEKKE